MLLWLTYQSIANPWNSEDIAGMAGVWLDLLAQVADMGFDQASIPIVTVSPDMSNNLAGRTDVICIHREQMQQLAFGGCQSRCFPIDADFVVQRVNTNRASIDDRRRSLCQARAGSAAHRTDSCEYLSREEGFMQVVIGSRLQATNLIMEIFPVCHHQHQCIMDVSHIPAHCQRVHILEYRVKKDKIRPLLHPLELCSLPVIRTIYLIPKVLQPTDKHLYPITVGINN